MRDHVSSQSDVCVVFMHVLPAGGAFCLRTKSQTPPSSMCMMWTTAYPPTSTTMTLTVPSAPLACSASRTLCSAAESCHEGRGTLWLITTWLSLQVTFQPQYSPLQIWLFLSVPVYICTLWVSIHPSANLCLCIHLINNCYLFVCCLPIYMRIISVLRPLCWNSDLVATQDLASRIM